MKTKHSPRAWFSHRQQILNLLAFILCNFSNNNQCCYCYKIPSLPPGFIQKLENAAKLISDPMPNPKSEPVETIILLLDSNLKLINGSDSNSERINKTDLHEDLTKISSNNITVTQNINAVFSSIPLIFENVVPTYVRVIFQPEEFQEFARTTLFSGVSGQCRSHSLELLSQLLLTIPEGASRQPEQWALQMADAWGKFHAGMLSGHTGIPGDFHECIQIRGNGTTPGFKGSYCSTYLTPGEALLSWLDSQLTLATTATTATSATVTVTVTQSMTQPSNQSNINITDMLPYSNLRDSGSGSSVPEELILLMSNYIGKGLDAFPFIGTCFPSSCSTEDSRTILRNFYAKTANSFLEQTVAACYTDEKPAFDTGDFFVIFVLSMVGFLCVVGSLFDIMLRQREDIKSRTEIALPEKLLLAFSIPFNTEKLLNTNYVDSDNLSCLYGLRFLSVCWIVLGHTWTMNILQSTWNLHDLQNFDREWALQTFTNGTVAVDTFFVISGVLLSYNLLREINSNRGKFNYPLLVVHRILRLTPTYLIIVGIMATLVPYLGSGPRWFMMERESELCEKNWWYNVLYVNNFIDQTEVCFSESWYLANDMQFFIMSPLIIYPIWRRRKIGFGILGALIIASIVAPAVITFYKELPPSPIASFDNKTYLNDMYVKPWTRMGPYLVGIFLGYVLYTKFKKPRMYRKIPIVTVLVGWLICTLIALLVIFGIRDSFNVIVAKESADTLTSVATAVYAGFHRFAWGIVISWIIFACATDHGGWVNKFLSWNVFVPLGRLTFCIYISSFHVQKLYYFSSVHPINYSTYGSINMFFAHLVMCCLVGYILTITLESPFIQIEKLLLPPRKRNIPPKTDLPIKILNNNNDAINNK